MSKFARCLCVVFLVLWFEDIDCTSKLKYRSLLTELPDLLQWSWIQYCQLQPQVGDCRDEKIAYYYDMKTNQCQEFTYSGCNGNKNRFPDLRECERYCKGSGFTLDYKILTTIETCSLQPNPGNCLAYMPHFYYDVNAGQCKMFVFGGCGGNPNRFPNEEECQETCGVVAKARHILRGRRSPGQKRDFKK